MIMLASVYEENRILLQIIWWGTFGSTLDLWPLRQYQRYAPSSDMGLKLDQSSVSHSHNFCFIFTRARIAGRINFRSKVLWLPWNPSPSTARHAWLSEMASLGSSFPITRSLNQGHPHRFLGVSTALGFCLKLRMPQNSRCLFHYSLPTTMWFLLFHPYTPPVHLQYLLYSPFPGR